MSEALPFLGIGLLLIVFLILSLLREKGPDRPVFERSEGDKTPSALHAEPFPQEWTDRLFGSEDRDFIAKQGSARLTRLFLHQRTALALSWLHNVRVHLRKLMRVHRAAVRTNSRLKPLVELRIGVDYLLFEMLCQLIALAIRLRGPVDLKRLVGRLDSLSSQLSEVIMRFSPSELAREDNKHEPHLTNGRSGGYRS
jgi:hypothetical protein